MRFRFAEYELDESAFELRHRGAPVSIAPLPLNLLLHLLRSHPAAPSKEELLDALWPDSVVGEASLSQAVRAVRVALGEGARDAGVLQTVRGRGFRIGVPVVHEVRDVPAPAGEAAPRHPIFGRESELAQVRQVLDSALAGAPQLLVLMGEPGIGKTRLAEEICREARERDAQVLVGRGLEGEAEPAFWPWVQMLRTFAAMREPAELARDLGVGAGPVANVVPEVAARLPSVPEREPLDPEQARFAFFDAVTGLAARAASDRPLVLVIEDLHWADESSLLLLGFLAQELPAGRLLVVATCRAAETSHSEALQTTLASLARSPHASQTLLLGGLEREPLGRIVEEELGAPPSPALLDSLVERTEGNPLFARELAQLVETKDGELASDVPPGVQQVIRRRLAELPDATRRVLDVASVLGREFDLGLLSRAAGSEAADLLDALDAAEQARLVEPSADAAGALRFSHALVRETLEGDLSTRDRVRFHLAAGQALEALNQGHPEPVLTELALHFAAALPAGSVAHAFGFARRAAEQDLRLLAFEQAERNAELALRIAGGAGEVPGEERVAVLRTLADARLRAGRREASADAWWRVVDLARRSEDAGSLAEAAAAISKASVFTAHSHDETVGLLREALEKLGEADTPLRAQVLSWLARQLTWTPEADHQQSLTREAVEMARRIDDRDTLLDVLGARGSILELAGEDDERSRTYEELLEVARIKGSRVFQADALTLRLQHRIELADPLGVDRDLAASERIARDLHHPLYQGHAARARAMRALWRGDVEDAERLVHEAFALGERLDPEHASLALSAQLGALRRLQGRVGELEAGARVAAEQYPMVAAFRCALASILLDLGRHDESRKQLEAIASDGFADVLAQRPHAGLNLALLSEVAAGLGDADAAARLFAVLEARAGRYLTVPNVVTAGCASRCLGMLASTMSRHDVAERHFEEALRVERRMGADAWLATTLLEQSRARLRAGREAAALESARESRSVADDRGMDGPLAAADALCGELSETAEARGDG